MGGTKEFGTRLRAHRYAAGLSQHELANRSGLSAKTIGNLERGQAKWPHPNSVLRLADALGLNGQERREFTAAAGRRLAGALAGPDIRAVDGLSLLGHRRIVPRQLPGHVREFTGRHDELAALTGLLENRHGTAPAIAISAISGMAGVGKTALAVHWAQHAADRFPDGQLYVNLRGYDREPPMPASDALAGFLRALGVPGADVPAEVDERAAQFRSLLAGRRVLLLLDNAAEAEQVRALLPGDPGCVTLVTSRDTLPGLVAREGAVRLDLDLLPLADAVGLLRKLIGPRVDAEPGAATVLAQLCSRLPRALRVAAELAASRPGASLAGLNGELADQQRLDRLDAGGDPRSGVRAVFSWSYQRLQAGAARLFPLLGLHPGPDISVLAAASLASVPAAAARRDLSELVCAHLISEPTPGRYALHDLLRAYATEQARGIGDEQSRRAATLRLLDYYLHSAHAADRLLNPVRDQITLPACTSGVQSERFADYGQAMAWFRAEHQALLAVVSLAVDAGYDAYAWQLPWTMVDFLEFNGHWQDWMATQRIAIAAARRLGDRAAEAGCGRALGYAYARTGSGNDALDQLRRALWLFHDMGDSIGEARTHQDLSWVLDQQGQTTLALRHDQTALRLYEQAGHVGGQAKALNAIGWLHAVLGDYQKAIDHCHRALVLQRKLGHRRGEAATLDSLGYTYHHLGQPGEAVAYYQRSLSLFQQLNDRSNEAQILIHLGDAYRSVGDLRQTEAAWRRALTILDDLHHPDAGQLRAKIRTADGDIRGAPAGPGLAAN